MEPTTTVEPKSVFQAIPLDKIKPSRHQARKQFDEDSIKALAESMKQEGLLQPITVRQVGEEYELIGGERRFRAARLLDWAAIDAKVIQTVSEGEAAAKGLIENLQREDLNPIDEAQGFQELTQLDPGYWSQDRIVEICGKSKTYVSRSLALLGLPEDVRASVATWQLSRSHAEALLTLDDQDKQIALSKDIIKNDWSVRETERRIKDTLNNVQKKKVKKANNNVKPDSKPDPLADLWSEAIGNPAIATPLSWSVSYGPQPMATGALIDGWNFLITTPGMDPKAELAKWFRNMADALSS